MRARVLSVVVVIGLCVLSQPASALSCARQTAVELRQRGDVAATGVVSSLVPGGFIFAADGVYKGDLPAHVLVVGQYRPQEVTGSRLFVVMRFHLPGLYSMDVCDGRPWTDSSLGPLGAVRPPSSDLPLAQAAVGILVVLAMLLLVLRRGRGKPAAPAAASAY